jgi:hypothetical protein
MLLNNLNFSTSYNFNANGKETLDGSLLVSGGTQFFQNKMNVNFGATLDPMQLIMQVTN